MDDEKMHPMRYVARCTGLSPHTIRAWERRHGAVMPGRTATNRRRYSDADVERLVLLRQATELGHTVSGLAKLDTETLRGLVYGRRSAGRSASPRVAATHLSVSPAVHVEACMEAVRELDAHALDANLRQALLSYNALVVIEEVIIPLLTEIGDQWESGSLKIVNEHVASSVVRSFLGELLRSYEVPPGAPTLITATPAGQLHELGALMAAVLAVSLGWNALYLGANLPAEEVASAASHTGAKAVALMIEYGAETASLVGEVRKLGRSLDDDVLLILGGPAAGSAADALGKKRTVLVSDVAGFRKELVRHAQA